MSATCICDSFQNEDELDKSIVFQGTFLQAKNAGVIGACDSWTGVHFLAYSLILGGRRLSHGTSASRVMQFRTGLCLGPSWQRFDLTISQSWDGSTAIFIRKPSLTF